MSCLILRLGEWIEPDEGYLAWESGDLSRMLAARSLRAHPIDRHFLLQRIVQETYRLRSNAKMRQACIESGLTHLEEFPSMIAPLRAEFEHNLAGKLPRVPSFVLLAATLAEDGRVDEAIRVCRTAAQLGCEDGTKGGYLGRAERLAKKYSR